MLKQFYKLVLKKQNKICANCKFKKINFFLIKKKINYFFLYINIQFI